MIRTVNDAYLDLRAEFKRRGIAGYSLEARELVAFALGLGPEEFFEKRGQYIFEKDEAKIDALKARRYSGVPLQHITGRWEFYGLPLEVTEDTLIPRPDTETLAERGIALMSSRTRGRFLDLCCGTGCVGLAILKHVSDEIHGVFADLSEPALEVARHNITALHLTGRALAFQADAAKPADPVLGRFQLIVCNPPYIPTEEIPTLDIEVQKEPHMALDGGADGLDFYHTISEKWKDLLPVGGRLYFEVGIGQADAVLRIMRTQGFGDIQVVKDTQGIPRVVFGTLCGEL